MRVVLIDPPTSHEQIYGDWDLSEVDTLCPPLGLLYIASFIREHGHTPHVLDLTARKWTLAQAVAFVKEIDPEVVGISAKTINICNAAALAERLKVSGFNGPIVLGGAHVTAVPLETLTRFRGFDFGVLGEGELTFLELLNRLDCGESVADIAGIALRSGLDGVQVNPHRPMIEDLDALPLPAWDLLEDFPKSYPHSALETKRLPAASIMTSRGCPFSCTFCDNTVFGTRVRHHSARYTLAMIRHLKECYGVRDLMILDDNFLLNRDKLFEICDSLIAGRSDTSWYCIGHAKSMTEDRLRKIRDAGCWFIELGIESGCDRILEILKKNTDKREIAEAVQHARRAGLKVKGNFIFGLPTETKESLEETIEFATSIGLTHFQQNFLTIWPGCSLSDHPEKYGVHTGSWETMAHQRITFIPHGLTEADLIAASRRAFRRFYLRPRIVVDTALSVRSARALIATFKALLVFVRTVLRRSTQTKGLSATLGAQPRSLITPRGRNRRLLDSVHLEVLARRHPGHPLRNELMKRGVGKAVQGREVDEPHELGGDGCLKAFLALSIPGEHPPAAACVKEHVRLLKVVRNAIVHRHILGEDQDQVVRLGQTSDSSSGLNQVRDVAKPHDQRIANTLVAQDADGQSRDHPWSNAHETVPRRQPLLSPEGPSRGAAKR